MDNSYRTVEPHRMKQDSAANDNTWKNARERMKDGRFQVGDLVINRYKILAELGQGGMGVVYKCFDETAGIEVALKALPPELSHNTLEMEDIKDNFQLVHNLHHSNIAAYNNLERDHVNGNYYLIMECCEGEDLRRWIKRKQREQNLIMDDVLTTVRQVAEALDYAHEMKIIHRDIKPGNIMIDNVGKIKILDFGLAAQIHTSMTRVSMAYHGTSGTGPYMAPEQWRGRAQGAPADLYSLAVMTYEMLAGHLPFESADPAVLKQAVLDEIPPDIPGVPQYVQNALKRAMSKEPSERFESCSDFVAALNGKKIKAAKKQKKIGTLKWGVILSFILLLATCGTGYYFFVKHLKGQKRITEVKIPEITVEKAKKEPLAKLTPEKAEKEPLAKLTPAKAEKEPLAKLTPEKAEKEPLAKLTPEEAEKEPLAKLTPEKAEKERLAKLTEEQLDSENAALKVELRDKIALIKQKNYDSEQGFGLKINEMNIAYATAKEAHLLTTANKKYKKAKVLADWLLLNGELRENAKKMKTKAQNNRSLAEKYEPSTYANRLIVKAGNLYRTAEKFYNETKFADASNRFREAAKVFEQAEKTAFDNKLQFLTDAAKKAERAAKWNELKIWAGKIRPLNSSLASQFETQAENELKAIAVEMELQVARNARTEKNWQRVYDFAVAALNIDNSNTEAQNLKQEAEHNLIPTLAIYAYVNGKIVNANIKALKTSPERKNKLWKLQKGAEYEFEVTYQSGENEYYGKIPSFTCTANGQHRKNVILEKVAFNRIITLTNGVILEMVKVDPGTFTMSKKDGENNRGEVEHKKTLTKVFYIGKYEVTNAQWCAVMGVKSPPSVMNDGDNYPVEEVSWYEAMKFCEMMNQYAPKGWLFTLPTETQWEFAARGGNKSKGYKYSGSDNLDDVGWFNGNSSSKTWFGSSPTTHLVGQKQPNELGLYDMSGNVYEWCLDSWNSHSNNTRAEFVRSYSDSDNLRRVGRGGGWRNRARNSRLSGRQRWAPGGRSGNLGFRIALVPEM